MTVSLSLIGGAGAQFFDNNGNPLTGGKLITYEAGTTVPAPTYTNSSGGTAHTNPIILDSAGRVPGGELWLDATLRYKFVMTTSTDVLIATWDNIYGIGNGEYTPQNFTGDGTQTSFSLGAAPLNENSTFVYINGVYQNKTTYSVSGNVVLFSEAPPMTSIIEISYQ